MSDKGHNGYTNYETWAVALWIDNEQGSQERALELAREAALETHPRYEMTQALKTWIRDEDYPEAIGGTLYGDLLGAALDSVDWYQLADGYLAQVAEDEEAEA